MGEVPVPLTEEYLRSVDCWFDTDRVPGDSAMTAFKRRARLHQALWRQERGLPIGVHEHRNEARPVGSRLAFDMTYPPTENFITPAALRAVRARLEAGARERGETLDERRLHRDLLSSMPMCFNLFGDLWAECDAGKRTDAARRLFGAPGVTTSVKFEHSPGRNDSLYLGNRSAFDVAFYVELDNGGMGIVGVETKYHEHAIRTSYPKTNDAGKLARRDAARARHCEVAERSGVFRPGAIEEIEGSDLHQIWLDHLLVLSMLQHRAKAAGWAKFVLVHPAKNPSFAKACERYSELLSDDSTFAALTIEEILESGLLRSESVASLRTRYLWEE